MGIVATIEFGSKEGKERILFNITKAFKAIILWVVRILYSLQYFLVINFFYSVSSNYNIRVIGVEYEFCY